MMKARVSIFAALLVAGTIGAQAQVDVGAQDFESDPLGPWTNAAANVNVFGDGGTGATIVDSPVVGQELQVDIDMEGSWNSGVTFNLDMSGNISRKITDYELEFYFRVDPTTWTNLNRAGSLGKPPSCTLNLYNPDAPDQGSEFKIQDISNFGDAVTNGAVLTCTFNPDDVYIKWDKDHHIDADISTWRVEISFGFGGGNGNTGPQPILFFVDDMVARYIPPPMVNPEGSPVGNVYTKDVLLTGTVYDGSTEVETLELHLDGPIVNATSNNLGGTITNVITYNSTNTLPGAHTAAVKGYNAGTNTVWHEWDFYVVSMTVPEENAGSPVGLVGSVDQILTGSIVDAAYEVDTLEMYLNDTLVNTTSGHLGGSVTNSISYNAMGLANGEHTVSVVGYDITGFTVTNEWSFYVSGGFVPPATNIVGLYNFNLQGANNAKEGYKAFPVADGTVAAAPSLGDNNWNNVQCENAWAFWYIPWNNIQEGSGAGILPSISVDILNIRQQSWFCWWSWNSTEWADRSFYDAALALPGTNTMWAMGYGGTSNDSEVVIGNLNQDLNYDLYIYFVNPDNNASYAINYELTQGFAPSSSNSIVSSRSTVFTGGTVTDNYVEGDNYTVFTDIKPDVDGDIGFKIGDGIGFGGISAFQLAAIRPDATITPNITSFDAAAGTVDLSWDSELFIEYKVLRSANLGIPSWTEVTNGIAGQAGTTSVSVPTSGGTEFYIIEGE